MAPLPKRKHSTMRKGKRIKTRSFQFSSLVKCAACGKMKKPHLVCKKCGT
ncbi:MAG TPA: 50S ribosomal protein L32 [Patescibacteria group bacterium]|nr:50S ribosomal protein L32 [Patescibacteria group bacterium]